MVGPALRPRTARCGSSGATIVKNHGGRIWVTDAPEGGADFRFTVPTCEENARRQQSGAASQDGGYR